MPDPRPYNPMRPSADYVPRTNKRMEPRSNVTGCYYTGCSQGTGHFGPHDETDLHSLAARVEKAVPKAEAELMELSIIVLRAMAVLRFPDTDYAQQQLINRAPMQTSKRWLSEPNTTMATKTPADSFPALDLRNQQVRLFELYPNEGNVDVRGSFKSVELSKWPEYIALSYTWGDQGHKQMLKTNGGHTLPVGENLWQFLRIQASVITEPTSFWIDAIGIDQSNVHERNHQVGLMKDVYAKPAGVFVWLGKEADNSDLAMNFLVQQASEKLRRKSLGYHPVWPRSVGAALHALCERRYWRRMWIIQELLHASAIAVRCGTKQFAWSHLEILYTKLKTFEESNWFAHHPYHMMVMHGSAATMIWQRAHYRHPDTPAARLRILIETFRD